MNFDFTSLAKACAFAGLMLTAAAAAADVTGAFDAPAPVAEGQTVSLAMRLSPDQTVHGINGKLTFDPALLSGPTVSAGSGASGFTAMGNLSAPGEFNFVLFPNPVGAAMDLSQPVVEFELQAATGLASDRTTTVAFDAAKSAAARVVTTNPADVDSLPNVAFQPVDVTIEIAAEPTPTPENFASDWADYE